MKKYNEYRKSRYKKEGDVDIKKCPFCKSPMKYKGPKNSHGVIYWKCRNKCCGRTVDYRSPPPKNVVPLVYIGPHYF